MFYRLLKTAIVVTAIGSTTITAYTQKPSKIELLNSNTIEFDKRLGNGAKRLIGNVQFKHDDAYMNCDSAYFYENNTFDAFGHIHISRGDTLHLYGDLLLYDGQIKLAKVRKNVRLIDKETVVVTEQMDYHIKENYGYYFDGGKITNADNKLESVLGHYYANDKMFFFRSNVVITNPKYKIYSDTMRYHTVTRTAFFMGSTRIVGDENLIYCENGWYNTQTNISQFNKNAYLQGKQQTLKGDSLYYERNIGLGKAYRNVELIDTVQNVILKGHYGKYIEAPEFALITDSALMIKIDNKLDSLFVHSDTLKMQLDSSGLNRIFKLYRNVRMFKLDMQGKCDSLSFTMSDSILHMYYQPALWSGLNQLTAERIELTSKNGQPDRMYMYNSSFIISKEDTVKYNQIKGRDMEGFFVDGKLYKIQVTGNAQTLYYPKDGEEYIGANKAESSKLDIYLKESKIDRIRFLTKPDATLFPLEEFPKEESLLRDFIWLEHLRPLNKFDIFRTPTP